MWKMYALPSNPSAPLQQQAQQANLVYSPSPVQGYYRTDNQNAAVDVGNVPDQTVDVGSSSGNGIGSGSSSSSLRQGQHHIGLASMASSSRSVQELQQAQLYSLSHQMHPTVNSSPVMPLSAQYTTNSFIQAQQQRQQQQTYNHNANDSGRTDGDRVLSSEQLSRQMSQLANDVAMCVQQNKSVLSMLERVVRATESIASAASADRMQTNLASADRPSSASQRENLTSSSRSIFDEVPARSTPTPTLPSQYLLDQLKRSGATAQINAYPSATHPDVSSPTTAQVSFRSDTVGNRVNVTPPSRSFVYGDETYLRADDSVENSSPLPINNDVSDVNIGPRSHVVQTQEPLVGQQSHQQDWERGVRDASLIQNPEKLSPTQHRRIPSTPRGRKRKAILGRDSLRAVDDDEQVLRSKESEKRLRDQDATTLDDDDHDDGADDYDASWQDWLEPRRPPPAALRDVRPAHYRSLKEVRVDRMKKTNRSLSTIGRIPLKEYLEVGGDDEYRAVRRLARTVYNTWLEQNVRLAKQDAHKLAACFNRIEYAFPILADCEGHWKARELVLQVIDNAIDDVALQKRKEARLSAAGQSSAIDGTGIYSNNTSPISIRIDKRQKDAEDGLGHEKQQEVEQFAQDAEDEEGENTLSHNNGEESSRAQNETHSSTS